MAGDWIKMRLDLAEDPAVMEMADRLGVREETVVGYCHAFWSWVSQQCHTESVTGVTLLSLGRRLNLPGFPELLCDVGWLEYDDSGDKPVIRIPHFDRHLSESAKKRAFDAQRKRASRDSVRKMSQKKCDKSVTREEKSREELSTNVDSKRAPLLDEVVEYVRQRGASVDPEQFHDHYTANGWRQSNGNKIKDWKAAVRTWERNDFGQKRKEDLAIQESNKHKPKPMTGREARFHLKKMGVGESRDWSDERCLTEYNRLRAAEAAK